MIELEHGGTRLGNVLRAKEDMLKSPEQLENEKREILSKRTVKLVLDGLNKEALVEQLMKFHNILVSLQSQYYDLSEKHDRQKYDMMELAERARQIEKGKAKTRKSNIVHTGLGGSVFNKMTENFPQAPGKISLFSRYERVTDRRSLRERRDVFAAPKEEKDFVPFKPKAKLKELEQPVKKSRTLINRERLRKPLRNQEEEKKAIEQQDDVQQQQEPEAEVEVPNKEAEEETHQQTEENEQQHQEEGSEEAQAEDEDGHDDEE